MVDKVVPLHEVRNLVQDGDAVAIGGAWLANKPMAAIRELIRAGRRGLHVISVLGSLDVELLVAAQVVDRVTFSMVSLESFGLAPSFRHAVETGTIDIVEMTGLSLEMSIEAAARRLPWLPYLGLGSPPTSALAAQGGQFGVVQCPFSGSDIPVVRPTKPDVAIIHALRADAAGNAQFDGTFGIDEDLAAAADRVVVTCEEIVDRSVITGSPHMTQVPGILVDAVISAPFGAHPTSHVPRYALDGLELLEYVTATSAEARARYIDRIRNKSEDQYQDDVVAAHAPVLTELAAMGSL